MTERRRWIYRALLAVGAPVLIGVTLEGGLRLAGYGRPASFLIPDERAGYFRTNPSFARLFLPGNFDLRPLNFRVAAQKPAGGLRVVVLGESAAQGVPVPTFGFAPQLRAQLRGRYPGRSIEVLDTGIVAVNSHVVARIAQDMAVCHPDLFIVYAGNNEVIGPYGPGCAYLSAMPPFWLIRLSVALRASRSGQLVQALIARLPFHRPPADWGGMSMFVQNAVPGDDPRLQRVYANFADNLRAVQAAARRAGAQTLFCTVVGNWQDCPPFLSRHRPDLPAAQLRDFEAAFGAGELSWRLGDEAAARGPLETARRIDEHYADTWWLLGRLSLGRHDEAEARRDFAQALHWDALRFRPDPQVNATIRAVAAATGAPLLDAAREMGADPDSTAPLAGRQWLFEHVHFDWPGNAHLARLLAEKVASLPSAGAGTGSGLDDAACAAAVGYTPHERLPLLLRMEVLVRKPPFSEQLTYIDDEARITREIDAARATAASPSVIAAARGTVAAAVAADPENPMLAGIEEGLAAEAGDLPGALRAARRAQTLLPRDGSLVADEASLLLRLQQTDAAAACLRRADDDPWAVAPLWAQVFRATSRWDEGRRWFERALRAHPGDRQLQLVQAAFLEMAGDRDAAADAYRAVLQAEPGNAAAQEGLVALLLDQRKPGEAAQVSLDAAPHQPQNQANDLRAVRACGVRGDSEGELRWLEAAETAGPVNATFELSLALKFFRLERRPETMRRLAEARRLSLAEGNPSVTAAISRLIERVSAR